MFPVNLGDSRLRDPASEFFIAKLTGVADANASSSSSSSSSSHSPLWVYSWIEQSFDPVTAQFQDAPSARFGGWPGLPPMYELNGQLVATPCYVYARLLGYVDGFPTYEFAGVALGLTTKLTRLLYECFFGLLHQWSYQDTYVNGLLVSQGVAHFDGVIGCCECPDKTSTSSSSGCIPCSECLTCPPSQLCVSFPGTVWDGNLAFTGCDCGSAWEQVSLEQLPPYTVPGIECAWRSAPVYECGNSSPEVAVFFFNVLTGTWQLDVTQTGVLTGPPLYDGGEAWDCQSPLPMTLISQDQGGYAGNRTFLCLDFPGSVTVTPNFPCATSISGSSIGSVGSISSSDSASSASSSSSESSASESSSSEGSESSTSGSIAPSTSGSSSSGSSSSGSMGPCCGVENVQLHLNFVSATAGCLCLLDQSVLMLPDTPTTWAGFAALCSETTNWVVTCIEGTGWSVYAANGCVTATTLADTVICDPLTITWNSVSVSGCCSGEVQLTLTL